MFRNSKVRGDCGVGKCIAYYTELGCTVSVPLSDSQDYDLVVEIEGKLKKIQIKTTQQYSAHSVPKVELRTSGGNRSGIGKIKTVRDTDIDFLFVYHLDGAAWSLPKSAVEAEKVICLGKNYTEYLLYGSEKLKQKVIEEKVKPVKDDLKTAMAKRRKVKERPSKEELKKLVDEHGYSATGRIFSVSDNAIRKWLK